VNTTIVTLGLYPSSGGPSKSIRAFQRALAAAVVSWVDPRQFEREPLIWERSTVVRGSRLPVLRQLLVPQRGDLPAAERLVGGSDLVSVHSFYRWHCQWVRRTARRRGVPYWFVPHGSLDPYVLESDRASKQLFLALGGRRFLADAAAIVCATKREHDKLRHFAPHVPGLVVPWPLDAADFRPRDPFARTAVRQSLGIPDDALCMLFFGRLHPMKRPLETIAALAESGASAAHLLVVGNEFGVTLAECRERARALGVADRVHVVGPAYGDEKHGYLAAADVYVSLSSRENFNFTAAESLAAGLPVILSPGNDLAPELASVGCGWMLADAADAPQAIRTAAGTPAADLERMAAAGRAWCRRELAEDVFAARLREAAAAVAGRSLEAAPA